MSTWEIIRLLHIVAMAFFVGGQLVLAAAVVPVMRHEPDNTPMRAMARRFAYGSLIAVGILIATGTAMAAHLDLWGSVALQVKMTLVGVTAALILWHMRRPQMHALEGLAFLTSMAIVWIGVALSH
ncbi:MAG: hypothetical protein HY827_02545 [Actinobacteria bacterium]|nr:hypothetical protein [Actinomycetota bacterium]